MKYNIQNPESLRHVLHVIGNLDCEKDWTVEVKKKTKGRTLSQNALYWRWMENIVSLASEDTGYEKDELAAYFKSEFLPKRIVTIGGVETEIPGSTKKLTTKEMVEYMDRIDRFCIQNLAISLPIPCEMQMR